MCPRQWFNPIIDVQVNKAHVCENEFLIPSLEASEPVLKQDGNQIIKWVVKHSKHLTSVGGYDG